jgi:hypothetical protein
MPKTKAKIQDTDKGLKDFLRRIEEAKSISIKVGILAGEGAAATNDGKSTVIDVAEQNEFGIGVPERSFIRAWADGQQAQNQALIKLLGERIVKGEITKQQAIDQIGTVSVASIQKRISEGIEPPNSPKTIRKKGSSTPLIDTGQLRSSISYAVATIGSSGE